MRAGSVTHRIIGIQMVIYNIYLQHTVLKKRTNWLQARNLTTKYVTKDQSIQHFKIWGLGRSTHMAAYDCNMNICHHYVVTQGTQHMLELSSGAQLLHSLLLQLDVRYCCLQLQSSTLPWAQQRPGCHISSASMQETGQQVVLYITVCSCQC